MLLQQQQNNNGTATNINSNAPDLVSNFVNNTSTAQTEQIQKW